MLKWFWHIIAVIFTAALVVITALFWSAWRASPFQASAFGQPMQSGIDVIAIQLDILSLVVALVGIGLAVMSIIGYQAIKAAAITKADEVATAAFALHMESKDKPGTGGAPPQPPIEPGDVTELTEEEKGD